MVLKPYEAVARALSLLERDRFWQRKDYVCRLTFGDQSAVGKAQLDLLRLSAFEVQLMF